MNEARRKFYSDFIIENNSNQRNLFSATKRLLNHGHEVPFPPTSDKLVLANEMAWVASLFKRLTPSMSNWTD